MSWGRIIKIIILVKRLFPGHIPNSGDMIEFKVSDKPTSNKHKEPTIAKMALTGKQATGVSTNDSRVECPHCHKKIMPRLVTYHGKADRSLCPLCGSVVSEFVSADSLTEIFPKWLIIFVIIALVIAFFLTNGNVGTLFPILFISSIIIYWIKVKPGAKNKVKVKQF